MMRTLLLSGWMLLATPLIAAESTMQVGQHSGYFQITRNVRYLLFLPDNYQAKEKWPMLVFLHGRGERGDNIELVKKHGPPKIVENKKDFPFIVLSPQCPLDQSWSSVPVIDLIDEIASKYRVDPNRIYLTGLSMGGYGTWDIATRYPYRFAALAPICGGGNPAAARLLRHLPIWVFHGAKDNTVPLSRSQEMVEALREVDGNVKFTVYPEAGHDSWTATYDNPELYQWFLKHKRQEQPQRRPRPRSRPETQP